MNQFAKYHDLSQLYYWIVTPTIYDFSKMLWIQSHILITCSKKFCIEPKTTFFFEKIITSSHKNALGQIERHISNRVPNRIIVYETLDDFEVDGKEITSEIRILT